MSLPSSSTPIKYLHQLAIASGIPTRLAGSRALSDNYAKPLTLSNLADSIKISPSYLGSIFKSVTGKSPITYLLEIRIHKAEELLKDGNPRIRYI
ncbi:helix-turn-helix domain-containing protein [Clostridium sediminicola]|uniref:helix-turn-helix domain-containing protein n=1 Tax=Clostridium sediminicola TaxID=3114879 RepID=UPI003D180DDF